MQWAVSIVGFFPFSDTNNTFFLLPAALYNDKIGMNERKRKRRTTIRYCISPNRGLWPFFSSYSSFSEWVLHRRTHTCCLTFMVRCGLCLPLQSRHTGDTQGTQRGQVWVFLCSVWTCATEQSLCSQHHHSAVAKQPHCLVSLNGV